MSPSRRTHQHTLSNVVFNTADNKDCMIGSLVCLSNASTVSSCSIQ